ncbi:MAG TPA: adenosine-specific kinase [Candidatus Omnitrophota bacterium]|nr:adenosine-specific kinase [Candidatus Omnitrophota bacterium]HPT07084.1 adenosine-specific kinase [Candidatus Omnitrophota bacterium]
MVDIASVCITKPDDVNMVFGQSHFIKTVEDLYEVLVGSVPGIQFGFAFVESSGACKIRAEGNNDELKKLACENALLIGAGHTFLVFMRNAYPINVLNAIKQIPEVCGIYCATANPVEVIIAESAGGRGVLGVIDGAKPAGIENEADKAWRKGLLRKIGYKL